MSDVNELAPPKGSLDKAEGYIDQLVNLLNQKKIDVFRTDLKKFDPTTLQNHYSIHLKDYQIEISHNRHQETGKNSYVMIFNNLKNISEGSGERVILGYIYLADSQYSKFKIVADNQIEARRRAAEEKRFNKAVEPIDQLLITVSSENSIKDTNSTDTLKEEFSRSSEELPNPPQLHQI
ncbi:hypothetical protein HYW44_03750 [Candidatus Daviesbacteria bacterium]|nr:hypothetical protein [Candidatus Daviesbacteria bacterium]